MFAGTLCTGGEAVGVVYATGMATQLGRIAALSQRVRARGQPAPGAGQPRGVADRAVAVGAGVAFLAIGTTVAGLPLDDALTFAIGLLVANVPEGLLPTITLALAVGVRRMARRRALVKRLTAVETLGSTDVICTDKTGTLTEGRMAVHAFWADRARAASGRPTPGQARPSRSRRCCAPRCAATTRRCAGSDGGWERGGDPSESALLVAAATLGEDVDAPARRARRRAPARSSTSTPGSSG